MTVQAHFTEHKLVHPLGRGTTQDITTQHLLNHPMSPLGLTIRLRMMGGAMEQSRAQTREELLPESRHELLIAIGDDLARHTEATHNPLQEQLSRLRSGDRFVHWYQRDPLGSAVNDSHDTILPLGLW